MGTAHQGRGYGGAESRASVVNTLELAGMGFVGFVGVMIGGDLNPGGCSALLATLRETLGAQAAGLCDWIVGPSALEEVKVYGDPCEKPLW